MLSALYHPNLDDNYQPRVEEFDDFSILKVGGISIFSGGPVSQDQLRRVCTILREQIPEPTEPDEDDAQAAGPIIRPLTPDEPF